MSVLAGMMIALGAIVYLKVGGVAGALLFSVGLMTVLAFEMKLFTGKVGLLANRQIKLTELVEIFVGNMVGVCIVVLLVSVTPLAIPISEAAAAIVAVRITNSFITNLIYGLFCGILMYIAVMGYKQTGNWLFSIVPVAVFILSGFNHCVADMFYIAFGGGGRASLLSLLATTIGNSVGGNIIPFIKGKS